MRKTLRFGQKPRQNKLNRPNQNRDAAAQICFPPRLPSRPLLHPSFGFAAAFPRLFDANLSQSPTAPQNIFKALPFSPSKHFALHSLIQVLRRPSSFPLPSYPPERRPAPTSGPSTKGQTPAVWGSQSESSGRADFCDSARLFFASLWRPKFQTRGGASLRKGIALGAPPAAPQGPPGPGSAPACSRQPVRRPCAGSWAPRGSARETATYAGLAFAVAPLLATGPHLVLCARLCLLRASELHTKFVSADPAAAEPAGGPSYRTACTPAWRPRGR